MKKFLLSLAILGAASSSGVATTWELASSIEEGAEYLLLSGSIVCSNSTGGAYLTALNSEPVVIEDDKIVSEIPSNAGVFRFEKSEDSYLVRIENMEGELSGYYNTTAAKKMSLGSESGNATPASVSFDDKGNVIVNFGSSIGILSYNSSSPRFLNYTSKQTEVQLYKKVGEGGDTPIDPDQPVAVKLSFPMDSYSVMLGEDFVSPELTASAEGLTISYSSSNPDVAQVDALSGMVTIVGIGSSVITAESEATEDYLAGEASYTLNVLDPDAIVDILNTDVVKGGGYSSVVTHTSDLTNVTYTLQAYNNSGYQFNTGKDNGVGIAATANPDKYVISRIVINPYAGMSGNQASNGVHVYASTQAYSGSGLSSIAEDANPIASPTGTDQIVIVPEEEYFYFNIVPNGGVYTIESIEVEWRKAELSKEVAVLSFPEGEYRAKLGEPFDAPQLTTNSDAVPVYSSSNENVASVDPVTGALTLKALGETVITAESPETDDFFYSKAEYKLYVVDPEEASFTVTFLSNDNFSSSQLDSNTFANQIEAGAAYVSSVSAIKTVYGGADGLKMGSNTNKGAFTLHLSEPVALDRINVTVSSMKTDDGSDLSVNGAEAVPVTDYHQVIVVPMNGEMTEEISFEAQLVYLKNIDFYAAADQPVLKDAGLAFPENEYEAEFGKEFAAPALVKLTDAEVVYTSSNEDVATVDAQSGEVTLVAAGTTVITASADATEDYKAGSASYTLTVKSAVTPIDPDPVVDLVSIVFKSYNGDGSEALTSSTVMNEIEEGAEYVSSIYDIAKVYKGVKGLKFGSSKEEGKMTIALADAYAERPVKCISVTASSYDSKASTLSINGISTLDVVEDYQVLNYSFNGELVPEITLESQARIYVSKIEISYIGSEEDPDPVVKKEFEWDVEYQDSFAEGADDIFFEILLPEDFGDAEGLFTWSCEDEDNVLIEENAAKAEVLVVECGTYVINVAFAGNEEYEASETTLTINVHPDTQAVIGISEGETLTVVDGLFFIPAYNEAYEYHYNATVDEAAETPVFAAPARIPAEYTRYDHEQGIALPGVGGTLSLVVAKNGVESPVHSLRYEVVTGVSGLEAEESDRAVRFTLDGRQASCDNRGVTITVANGRVEKTIR